MVPVRRTLYLIQALIALYTLRATVPTPSPAVIHGEVESRVNGAQRSPTPEPPCQPRPAAVFALSPSVDKVLSKHYDRSRKEPDGLLIKRNGRDRLLISEVGG